MKKTTLLAALLSLFFYGFSQTSPQNELAIRKVMADQVAAWNRGSVDDFMKGYWDIFRIKNQD